jgi:Domain of unknown function (DUF222)
MLVVEDDPQRGGFSPLSDTDLDGVGTDIWGNEWPLGGPIDLKVAEPFTLAPDRPTQVGDLEAMPPGPALASRLAAVSPGDVGDAELVEVIAAAERLARWSGALQIRAMAEMSRRPVFLPDRARDEDAELRSAGAQVAAELRLAQVTAEKRVWVARQLIERFPATFEAVVAGEIDVRRAELIAEVADRHGCAVAEAVESRVLPRAGFRTIGQHRRAIEREILLADPADAQRRHAEAAAGRRVWFSAMPDGMGQMVADLTADGMALVRAVLDTAAIGMKTADPDNGRRMDQRRADALVDLARLSLATGRLGGDGLALSAAQGRRPHIQVTVPLSTLIGIDDHPGELTGYGPIPASVARRIAADGVWRRLLTDPATGRPPDYGTTRYSPPQDLRDVIIARDRECVFPTCTMPAHRCQVDHTVPHPDGPTARTNLGPPCEPHHDLKTRWGWQLDQPEEGRFVWTSPVGKQYVQEPQQIGPITGGVAVDDTEPPDEPPF